MAADLADVEKRLDDIRRAFETRSIRLAAMRVQLKRSERSWRQDADKSSKRARDEAAKNQARAAKGIGANADEARSQAERLVASTVDGSAPRWLASAWDDPAWHSPGSPEPGPWVRVGHLPGRAALPIVLPISAGVWRVHAPDAPAFRALVHHTLLRLVAAFDVPRVRTVAYDPNLTLDLGNFATIRSVHPLSVPAPTTSVDDFERELGSLVHELAAVHDRLTASGYSSFWTALAGGHALATTTPLRLLVIAATPDGLSDRGVAQLAQARRLAADHGLLVVEVSPPDGPPGDSGLSITLHDASATTSAVPGVTWAADGWIGERAVRTICSALAARPRTGLAPTVEFASIVDGIDDAWMADADEGLEVRIGEVDGGPLVVRLRSENPPMPNVLIGGAVGQGKSNLLLVLIHALAARYSPTELEMVLLDLRDGVEFARLGPGRTGRPWLPHVRALGLELDPDYSIAVLAWVSEQMAARADLLKRSSSTTLRQFRATTGTTIPRLVVVIDEFQKLFEGDDDQVAHAAALLEGIARTGRGFGVHLVLASQAVTGIRGLAVRQDAIFGQFHNRITLKNVASESQAFLAPHNLAATELEHRGQVVVNDSLGAADRNTFGTVAYADEDYLSRLRSQLFIQGHGAPPAVFRSSAFAVWAPEDEESLGGPGPTAAVGLPVGIGSSPRRVTLTRSPNQGLAVVGADRTVAVSVLVRAVATAADWADKPHVTLLDGDSLGEAKPWIAALTEHLERHGATVDRVERASIASRLDALASARTRTDLLVAIALDSVDLTTPVEPAYVIPSESLRSVLKTGSLSGSWTIGWWQSKSVLDEHLGYRAPGIRTWAFCGVSREDLVDVCGHGAREPSARPRLVWFDRTSGASPERLVPFATDDVVGEVPLD